MHLGGGQFGGGTDEIVVCKLHVRQMSIPIIFLLVDDHSEYLSNGVVHALDAAVAVRTIRACCNFAHAL